jgi:hypothetical protein
MTGEAGLYLFQREKKFFKYFDPELIKSADMEPMDMEG